MLKGTTTGKSVILPPESPQSQAELDLSLSTHLPALQYSDPSDEDEPESHEQDEFAIKEYPPLQYYHQRSMPALTSPPPHNRQSHSLSSSNGDRGSHDSLKSRRSDAADLRRPGSTYTPRSELNGRGYQHSHCLSVGGSSSASGSQLGSARGLSGNRRSPEIRPTSYVDLLNIPYSKQLAPAPAIDNGLLRSAVGTNASLLNTTDTLQMYRANVKKTNNMAIQYEFAVFMVNTAQEAALSSPNGDSKQTAELLREARQILQRLADRGYPFAQYYLGDGYASGLFNKGKVDCERAFPLFVAASKHGHAEAGYRAALCYEFGWGCRKDYAKAEQFYRTSASKNHPGSATRLGRACLTGDMGLSGKQREGLTWLKRAAESADYQHNGAPYELGLLHTTGFGDDLFKDESYAAQLFTQSAELGHPEANQRMGEAYEHGLLSCPKDPALSVHFYTNAAQAGVPEAMMNLCAWYMVGAPPVLEKDENEAYEWAKRAAETGLPKANYAVGYFTEMGIGCRRDTLEANVWYVKAADQGDERAKQRLVVIQAAASGDRKIPVAQKKAKKANVEKDCTVM